MVAHAPIVGAKGRRGLGQNQRLWSGLETSIETFVEEIGAVLQLASGVLVQCDCEEQVCG